MEIAFPYSDSSWRQRNLARVYEHFSWIMIEYLVALDDPSVVMEWFTEIEGKEWLDEASGSGKGAVLLFGHFGNWELLGGWLASNGYPLHAMVREPDDPDVRELLKTYRHTMGMKTISKTEFREPVKLLKQGKFVGVAGDQHWGSAGLEVPFFGRSCSTASGPAAYSLLTRAPLIPIAAYRLEPFKYRFEAQQPITIPSGGSREDKIYHMTLEANHAIEKMIRRAPEQWLWMHRRWRK